MFALDGINLHNYSFAVIGLGKKNHSKIFLTRADANKHMYKICSKHGLKIEKIWDDNHEKTYHCSNGVTFYIHRV